MAKNLYTNEAIFRLIVDGNTIRINEPVKWDTVKIKLMRDPETYGVNSEFSEDETALQFPKGEGYEIIKEQYDLYGCDAYIEFSFSYRDRSGQESNEFYGTLNLSSYAVDDIFVYTTIEKQTFENLLRTRYETKVSFNSRETLDGEVLPVSDLYGTAVNANRIPFSFDFTFELTEIITEYSLTDFYLTPQITQIEKSDITSFIKGNMEIFYFVSPTEQFIVQKADFYTVSFESSGTYQFDIVDSAGIVFPDMDIYLRALVQVIRGGIVVNEVYTSEMVVNTTNLMAHNVSLEVTLGYTFEIGDKVFFQTYIYVPTTYPQSYFKQVKLTNGQNKIEFFKQASDSDYPFRGFAMDLHSKEIVLYNETKTPSNKPDTYDSEGLEFAENWCYIQLSTENVISQSLNTFTVAPLGVILNIPLYDSQYTFKATEAGVFFFEYNFSGILEVEGNDGGLTIINPDVRLVPFYATGKDGSGIKTFEITSNAVTVLTQGNNRVNVDNFSFSASLNLAVDDELFFGIKLYLSPNSAWDFTKCNISNSFSYVRVSQATVAPPTLCRAYNFLDAVKFIVKIITGADSDKVISSFFDVGGCGEKHAITNGFQIRNFEVFDRPVQASLKDLLEGARDFWNVGFSLKTDDNGVDYMIIQPFSDFFVGDEILRIDEVANLKDEHDKSLVFNEISIGFSKYADDDNNYLDDINTYHEYLTPIKTYKAKKAIQCKLITSGYLIEQQRREQFQETPSKSVTNDDELFLIKYVSDFREYKNIIFGVNEEGTTNTFIFSRQINLAVDTQFYLIGGVLGANDGVIYTVTSKDDFQELYYVTPSPIADLGECTIFVIVPNVEAEKNENYNTIGILNPNSAYNLSLTPKQQLFWWRNYFNIGLTSKQKADTLKCTFVKQNKDAQIEALDDTACQVLPSGYIKMDSNVTVSKLGYLNRPFTPVKVSFKCKLPYTQISLLKKGIRGEIVGAESFRNFGYITYVDYDGIEWQAHINNIEYNPMTEEVDIEAYKIDKN